MEQHSDREITSTERIKRIIGILRLDGREVEIHLPQYIETGKISTTAKDTFIVKLSSSVISFEEGIPESVFITFIFSGTELIGKCRPIDFARSFLTLEYPASLKSRIKRKYPRVRINGRIPATVIFLKPPEREIGEVSSRQLPVKYSKIYWEVQRETVDIKRLFLLIGKEVKNITESSEIVVYNREMLNNRDVSILRKSGKVLFIEDCRQIQSYTRFIPSDVIINYSYYLNEKKLEGKNQEEMVAELRQIIKDDIAKGFMSKALVPFFSKDKVIGHIALYSKEKGKKITSENLSDCMALSSLLTMGANKVGFLPELETTFKSSLMDISEGGLLLKVINHEKDVRLPEGAHLAIKIWLEDKELILRGNICRKNDDTNSYAIKFDEISSEARKEIKKFIEENIDKEGKSK